MRRNKKGSIGDVFYIGILLFVISIFFVLSWLVFGKINTAIQGQPDFSEQGKAIINNNTGQFPKLFDGVFLTILVGLWIATMILAWQIDTHPVFYVLTIIAAIALVIVTAVLGNTYTTMMADVQVSEFADDFTIIPFVMRNFVKIMLGMLFSVAVVMYAKSQ